jgi:hypothetical protein
MQESTCHWTVERLRCGTKIVKEAKISSEPRTWLDKSVWCPHCNKNIGVAKPS